MDPETPILLQPYENTFLKLLTKLNVNKPEHQLQQLQSELNTFRKDLETLRYQLQLLQDQSNATTEKTQ